MIHNILAQQRHALCTPKQAQHSATPVRPLPIVFLFLVLDSPKGATGKHGKREWERKRKQKFRKKSSDLIVSMDMVRLDVVIRWKFSASMLAMSEN